MVEVKHSYEAIMRKKRELFKLQGKVNAKTRELKKLRHDILELTHALSKKMQLPQETTPQELVAFLRKYRGINVFMAHTQDRNPIRFGELYNFNKEVVDKWTLKDIHDLIKTMQKVMHLTQEQAIAKTIVDLAFEYNLLYEYFQDIPNHFENFVDEKGRPACITKLAVLH